MDIGTAAERTNSTLESVEGNTTDRMNAAMTAGEPAETAEDTHVVRVAIFDDHTVVRHGLEVMLDSSPGFEVVTQAGNRADALIAMTGRSVDVALVDLSLGDSSGLELLKDLVSRFPNTRALVLSMHDEALFAHRCLEAGAGGYICKSRHPDELRRAIQVVAKGELYLSEAVSNDLLSRVVGRPASDRGGFVATLTDREYQVFEALGQGLTVREIAAQLHISRKTVENHRDKIKAKLGLGTANELLRHAVAWNLGATAISGSVSL